MAAGRSTPEQFSDCDAVRDSRGKKWIYSEPADVWLLMVDELTPAPHSARSFQRLAHEYGPLRKMRDR